MQFFLHLDTPDPTTLIYPLKKETPWWTPVFWVLSGSDYGSDRRDGEQEGVMLHAQFQPNLSENSFSRNCNYDCNAKCCVVLSLNLMGCSLLFITLISAQLPTESQQGTSSVVQLVRSSSIIRVVMSSSPHTEQRRNNWLLNNGIIRMIVSARIRRISALHSKTVLTFNLSCL